MKNVRITLMSLTLICLSVAASAQTSRGNLMIGGTASFVSTKQGDAKSTDLDFSPNAGYFIKDALALGARVNIGSSTMEEGIIEVESSSFALSPFARYYFLGAGQKINVFADASYSFGTSKVENGSSSFSGFTIAAGPAFFLTNNVAMEFTLGYNSMKMEDVDDRSNSIGFGAGFQIHLGKNKKAK